LEVADNLRAAQESVKDPPENTILKKLLDGVRLTDKILHTTLAAHGIEKLEAKGQKYDPNLHEVLMQVSESEHDHGHVATVFRDGYKIKGRILRAAQVGTSHKPHHKKKHHEEGGQSATSEQTKSDQGQTQEGGNKSE